MKLTKVTNLFMLVLIVLSTQILAPEATTLKNAYEKIYATKYEEQENIISKCTSIQSVNDGSWVKYSCVDFGDGAKSIDLTYASLAVSQDSKIELRVDGLKGPLLASYSLKTTKDEQRFTTINQGVATYGGIHDLYIIFRGSEYMAIRSVMFLKTPTQSNDMEYATLPPYDKRGLNYRSENNLILYNGSQKAYVNNEEVLLNTATYMKNNIQMYPLSYVCNITSMEANVNGENIAISRNKTVVKTKVGSGTYTINGTPKQSAAITEKNNSEIWIPEDILLDMEIKIFRASNGIVALSYCSDLLINETKDSVLLDDLLSLYLSEIEIQSMAEIFVSPNGNDKLGTGSRFQPYGSIEKAKEVVKTLKTDGMNGNIIVNLREGTYNVNSPVVFDESDSGTNGYKIIYRAYNGEKVVFSMSKSIKLSDFEPVTDNRVKSYLNKEVRDNVKQINLNAFGIKDYGDILPQGSIFPDTYSPIELFFDGEPMTLARYPNEGFIPLSNIVRKGSDSPTAPNAIIGFKEEQPLKWSYSDDIYVSGNWDYGWASNIYKIKIDKEKKQAEMLHRGYLGINQVKYSRYFYFNVLEELDSPGEYYVDRKSGMMYFYMPDNSVSSNIQISVRTPQMKVALDDFWSKTNIAGAGVLENTDSEPIFNLRNVSNITLENLKIGYACGSAIVLKDGFNNTVKNCIIENVGINAVKCSGGYNHTITGCSMKNTGVGAVKFYNAGVRSSLTKSMHKVIGNEIKRYDRIGRVGKGAAMIGGVGVTVAHNKISEGNHLAIEFIGNDNIIEYNDISDVLRESTDAGSCYAYDNYTFWNNTFRNNYIHDIRTEYHFSNSTNPQYGEFLLGIYNDNYISGNTTEKNLIVNTGDLGIFVHGGRNHTIKNNMVISTGDKLLKNSDQIRVGGSAYTPPLFSLNTMPVRSNLWQKKYPELYASLSETIGAPQHNRVIGNITYGTGLGEITVEQYDDTVVKQNNLSFDSSKITEPIFVDINNKDYRIKNIGDFNHTFNEISNAPDFAKMGLTDEFVFADNSDKLDRIFISSDLFNSGVANYKANVGDKLQLQVTLRSKQGYIIDNSKAKISYKSSDSMVGNISSTGKIDVVGNGKAAITVEATVNGITKSAVLNLYSSDSAWSNDNKRSENIIPYTSYINWKQQEDSKNAVSCNNVMMVKAVETLKNLGMDVSQDKEGTTARYKDITYKLYPDKDYLEYCGQKQKLTHPIKFIDGEMYVSEADLRIIGVYTAEVKNEEKFYVEFEESMLNKQSAVSETVIDVQELLNIDDWNLTGLDAKIENNILSLNSSNRFIAGYKARKLNAGEGVSMKIKMDFTKGWNALSLRNANTWEESYNDNEHSYLLVIKENKLEIQRFSKTSGHAMLKEMDNTCIGKNTWHNVVFSAVNVSEGVNLKLIVDGNQIFDIVDGNGSIKEEGYFTVWCDGGNVEIAGTNAIVN